LEGQAARVTHADQTVIFQPDDDGDGAKASGVVVVPGAGEGLLGWGLAAVAATNMS
jgi:hypothetical protein